MTAAAPGTVGWLAGELELLEQDLAAYLTNGDLPKVPVVSAAVEVTDSGWRVLLSGDAAGTPGTVAWLAGKLKALPSDLAVYLTNGDLDPVPVASAAAAPADFGQLALISR